MRRVLVPTLVALAVGLLASRGGVSAQAPGGGSIKGHVHLAGKAPGNAVIRMGMDPMCARTNAGKRILQEVVMAAADGSLANVFARLEGNFPQTPVPAQPVLVDQVGCVYTPRVVGLRIGQTLEVKNSDDLLHNVHSISNHGNDFNVGEPVKGMVQKFALKNEETMLRLKCDIHSWMTAFVGVVPHAYFAVSGVDGSFRIDNVPAGTRTVQLWHERYGVIKQTVQVRAGATSVVEFTYTGAEKPPTSSSLQDISLPPGARTALVLGPPAN